MLRAAEYIPRAIKAATVSSGFPDGIDASESRFGGPTVVAQSRDSSGKVDRYVTARGVDPVFDGEDVEIRWTIEGNDRVDTIDMDVFNMSGQVHVTIEAYAPTSVGSHNLIDDILDYFNRDGALHQVIAQHDEDVAPGRESEMFAHVAFISIPGSGLPGPRRNIGLEFSGSSTRAEWDFSLEVNT